MNFLSSTSLGSRYGHLSGLISLPRKRAKRAETEEETRKSKRADGKAAPEDNEPNAKKAEDDEEAKKAKADGKAAPEDNDPNSARKGGEAKSAKAAKAEDDPDDDPDDDRDEDENAGDDDDDDDGGEDDEDEEEMKRCEAAGFGFALDASRRSGKRAERARLRSIFASREAAGRVGMACELALHTSLSAKRVIAILGNSPAGGGLAAAMERTRRPEVGHDAPAKPAAQDHRTALAGAMQRLVAKDGKADPVDRLAAALAEKLRA